MSLRISDAVVPTIGALLDQLTETGKSGALAFGVIGGRLYNEQTGLAVAVRARFGNDSLEMETLPLLEVLKRVHRGEILTQLAAPPDSTTFVAVARLLRRGLVVGLRDHRGGLAAAALGENARPTRPARGWFEGEGKQRRWVRPILNRDIPDDDRVDSQTGLKAKDFRTADAETMVLPIEDQVDLTTHPPRARKPAMRAWHYWRVSRTGTVLAEGGGHSTFGREQNEYWRRRALEIDLPGKVLFRHEISGQGVTFASLDEEIPAEAEFEAKVIAQADFESLVERAKLPPGQRRVVDLLRQDPDLTEEDAARQLGLSRLNYRTQRDRAFAKIRTIGAAL